MATWKSLSVQVPAKDLVSGVGDTLEALTLYLDVLSAVLNTTKTFLVDFGNPVRGLAESLTKLIAQTFAAMKQTGVYAWMDFPDPRLDPNFHQSVGGYQAFTSRFKASLLDTRDPNRPQPVPGLDKSGFMLIVADAESVAGLVKLSKVLLRFLGKEFLSPQYAAPTNYKVLPVGAAGDPILSLAALVQDQPKSIAVEWSLPPASRPGDPGFSDVVEAFSTQFLPPKFLIERSIVNPRAEIDVAELATPSATGQVTAIVPSVFEERGKPGQTVNAKVRLTDEYGDPFIKFQKYIVVDSSRETGTFLLGQLGTFRYIDTDVEPGKTYYYRVRAFSGDLAVSLDGTLLFSKKQPQTGLTDKQPFVEWPSTSNEPPVMGRATPITRALLPVYPAQFDVIENLRRVFQVAFSLNFHLPSPAKSDPPSVEDIGKGAVTDLAGPLVAFQALPLVGTVVGGVAGVTSDFHYTPDPVRGKLPELPWQNNLVRYNSARLANTVAGAMLQTSMAETFRGLMQRSLPKGRTKLPAKNLQELVFSLTEVQDPGVVPLAQARDAAVQYAKAFVDSAVRENLLEAINFIRTFTLSGAGSNWMQVSILRDVAPWSGQILYELLAKMQGLTDAYQGVNAELKAYIELLERKINTLEKFIQYLVSILDFIENLSGGFYVLQVPETTENWASLVDSAEGSVPTSGPGGYPGGVAFGYVGPNVGAIMNAFSLLF